jgi:hypothetical protein
MQTENINFAAVSFFLAHAGFSYDPKTETQEQGRVRVARALAEAEALYLRAHQVAEVAIVWTHDDIAASEGGFEETCECACIVHDDGNGGEVLASLGAIWDADANYRRVIRAELAQECADKLREIINSGGAEHAQG